MKQAVRRAKQSFVGLSYSAGALLGAGFVRTPAEFRDHLPNAVDIPSSLSNISASFAVALAGVHLAKQERVRSVARTTVCAVAGTLATLSVECAPVNKAIRWTLGDENVGQLIGYGIGGEARDIIWGTVAATAGALIGERLFPITTPEPDFPTSEER